MSSARFLLEFEATGDQEVVNAIKEVGTAGKETAADLDALKNIEDPFSSLSEGADSAIGPIQEVGSAATETVSPLEDMGSATEELGGIFGEAGTSTADFTANMDAVGGAADATVGGLTDANKVVEDFGGAATTAGSSATDFGSSVTNITGGVAALGGIIGSTVSALFRYQDIQLKVQKAQLAAARAAETYRKSEASLSALLKTATSNAAGIAAARQRLAEAQARVNELMDQGVTSGAEWEAAQTELTAAQAALSAEFAKGGGNVAKLTTEMNKNEIAAGKNATATNNLEKVNRQANQGVLDLVFGFVSLTGTLVQTIGSLGKSAAAVKSLATAFKALIPAMTGVASAAATVGVGFAALTGIMTAIQVDAGGVKTKMTEIHDEANKSIPALTPIFDHMGKSFHSNVEGMGDIGRQFTDLLGITIPASVDVAKKKTEELGTSTKTMGTAMASTIDMTKGLNTIMQTTGSTVSTAEGIVVRTGGAFVTLGNNLVDLGNGTSTVNGILVKNTDILNQQGLSVEKVAKAYPAWAEGLKATASASAGMQAAAKAEGGAILATASALGTSNQKLQDAIAIKNDAIASSNQLHAALNNEMTGLINEEAALKATIAATQDAAIQKQALSNATLEGEAAAKTWIAALDEEAASEKANLSTLSAYASQFGQLPGVIEPTADAMQGFIAANEQGGQAALDFAHQVSSAYDDMLGEAGGMIDELAGIIQKGGEDMNENLDKWFEDLPEMVKEHLTDAQVAALQGIAEFQAAVNTTATEFEVDWMTEGFARAKQDLSRNLGDMKKIFAADFPEVFAVAQDIISHGSEVAVSRMVEIFKGAAKKPPQVILQELQALSATIPGTLANAAGTMPGTLDPAAAETGKSAAITLSEEFAAAGTHIAAVMAGIAKNMQLTPPKIDVDITPAANTLVSLVNTMNSIKQTKLIPVDVDVTPAAKTLSSLVATMSSIRQSSVPVFNINVTPALTALNKIRSALGGVKSGQAGINLNPAPALASIKKVINEMAKIKQGKIPQIQLNINPAVAAANKIRSIVNALPNIKRSITYTYRVVGSRPNPPDVHKKIVYHYTTVGSRPAQTGMHENLSEDTMIAAHKGERVDITPNAVYSTEHRTAIVPAGGRRSGAEYVIPVTLMLDNKVLVRTVSRGLMEDVGGVS